MLLAVLCLPITSLPLLSRLMGGTMVAPPSVVLSGLALVIWLPVRLAQREPFPREFVPLAAFVAAALVSAFLSFFISTPSYKQISSISEIIGAVLTLCIGLVSYAAFSLWGVKKERFTWLFRMVNLGGAIMLLWAFAQLYVLFLGNEDYPSWMMKFQNLIATSSLSAYSFLRRANGFAFEPSWLAHQLNVFYLPYWLGATLTGYTAFSKRIWRISVENILLAGGLAALLGSMSRIGLLSLLLLAGYLVFRFTRYLARRLARRFAHPRWSAMLIGAGLFLVYFVLAVGLVFAMSRVDPRLAAIFNPEKFSSDWFTTVNNLSLAERISYWAIGLYAFGRYPIFGVGLGNAGFFIQQAIPVRAPALLDFIKLNLQYTSLPNVKNLWLRLLGETGLVGFSIFAAWLYLLWTVGKFLQSKSAMIYRVIGWMGMLVIVAMIGEGFSVDTFALPYYWIAFGLLTAAGYLARREVENKQ
jgi:O-antigen ligase